MIWRSRITSEFEAVYKGVLAAKDRHIERLERELDVKNAQIARYEAAIFRPRKEKSKADRPEAAAQEPEGSWNAYLRNYMKQREEHRAGTEQTTAPIDGSGRTPPERGIQ